MLLLEKKLAVVFACDKFRPYIVDSKVTVHSNHAAKPRLIRWFSCYKNLICILLIERELRTLLRITCLGVTSSMRLYLLRVKARLRGITALKAMSQVR